MEKVNQSKSVFTIGGRHRFVACVIIVLLVSCAAFAYLSSCYKQAQEDIVALQRKDALMFEQVLNSSKNVKSKSSEIKLCWISIKNAKRLFCNWNLTSCKQTSMSFLSVYDYQRSNYLSGYLPNLFDYSTASYVNMMMSGNTINGFDYHTATYFSVTVNGGNVTIFDYQMAQYYMYSVN